MVCTDHYDTVYGEKDAEETETMLIPDRSFATSSTVAPGKCSDPKFAVLASIFGFGIPLLNSPSILWIWILHRFIADHHHRRSQRRRRHHHHHHLIFHQVRYKWTAFKRHVIEVTVEPFQVSGATLAKIQEEPRCSVRYRDGLVRNGVGMATGSSRSL